MRWLMREETRQNKVLMFKFEFIFLDFSLIMLLILLWMCVYMRVCIQAVAATLEAGAARGGPGAGQGEDARGQEIQHPQVGAGGLPPCHAAPQQGAGRPQQRDQWQWLNTHTHTHLMCWSLQVSWSICSSIESPALHHRTQTVQVAQSGKRKTSTTLAPKTHMHTLSRI